MFLNHWNCYIWPDVWVYVPAECTVAYVYKYREKELVWRGFTSQPVCYILMVSALYLSACQHAPLRDGVPFSEARRKLDASLPIPTWLLGPNSLGLPSSGPEPYRRYWLLWFFNKSPPAMHLGRLLWLAPYDRLSSHLWMSSSSITYSQDHGIREMTLLLPVATQWLQTPGTSLSLMHSSKADQSFTVVSQWASELTTDK